MKYHVTITKTVTVEAPDITNARLMAQAIKDDSSVMTVIEVAPATGPQSYPRSFEFQDNQQIDTFEILANDPKEW